MILSRFLPSAAFTTVCKRPGFAPASASCRITGTSTISALALTCCVPSADFVSVDNARNTTMSIDFSFRSSFCFSIAAHVHSVPAPPFPPAGFVATSLSSNCCLPLRSKGLQHAFELRADTTTALTLHRTAHQLLHKQPDISRHLRRS